MSGGVLSETAKQSTEIDAYWGSSKDSPPLLLYLGMGLLFAYAFSTHNWPIMVGGETSQHVGTLTDNLIRLGEISTLFIVAAVALRKGPLLRSKAAPLIAAACACVGYLLNCTSVVLLSSNVGLLAIGSLLIGVGGALLFLLWAELFGQLNLKRVIVLGAGGCAVAGFVAFVLYAMRWPYSSMFVFLLPAVSILCYEGIKKHLLPSSSIGALQKNVRVGFPWKPVLLMAACGASSGFAGSVFVGESATYRIISTGLIGLTVLLLIVSTHKYFRLQTLVKISLGAIVVGYCIMPFTEFAGIPFASFFAKLGYVSFEFFGLCLIANLVSRYAIPAAYLFGLARGASELAMFLARLIGLELGAIGVLSSQEVLFIVSGLAIAAVFACAVIWFREKSFTGSWSIIVTERISNKPVENPRTAFLREVELFGKAHGLTEREIDVFQRLAEQMDGPEIQNELFLSRNTVKTHIRHIYSKLDVHNRSELNSLLVNAGIIQDEGPLS